MGQQISSRPNPDGPIMRLHLKLTCDAAHHNAIIPAAEYEAVGDEFIGMRQRATALGWRRIDGGQWRGPCCNR